jgi:hypothetical protein
MPYPIIFVELATPDVPGEPLVKDRSWMLSGASSYFFLAPHMKKDASLGSLFDNVHPKDGNKFELELGVVLPDLFPNLEGRPEAPARFVRPACQPPGWTSLRPAAEAEAACALLQYTPRPLALCSPPLHVQRPVQVCSLLCTAAGISEKCQKRTKVAALLTRSRLKK